MPGAIDAHVHCYSSAEEGFETASRSAAAGGVTTIIEMPYDATGMICTEALFQEKAERLEGESIVDVALLATIFKEGGLDEIPKLARAGACGFKVSMFNTDSFRFPRIGDGQLMEAFSVIAKRAVPSASTPKMTKSSEGISPNMAVGAWRIRAPIAGAGRRRRNRRPR